MLTHWLKPKNTSGTAGGDGAAAEGPFGGASLLNQNDLKVSRAAAPTDQRHRFVFNGIYQIPTTKSENRFARALLNGYQLGGIFTAESGRPYSATISLPSLAFSQNGQIFTPIGGGIYGLGGLSIAPDTERNSNYGDANYKLDLRLSRKFTIKEKVTIELLAEGFNVFNRSNFNGFNSTRYNVTGYVATQDVAAPIVLTDNATFGIPNNDGAQPDGTNARRFQLAARFRF